MYRIIQHNYSDDETISFNDFIRIEFFRTSKLDVIRKEIEKLSLIHPKTIFEIFEYDEISVPRSIFDLNRKKVNVDLSPICLVEDIENDK